MTPSLHNRMRAVGTLMLFLSLLAVAIAADLRWLDIVGLCAAFALWLGLSARALLEKWRTSEERDVTRHGPLAVYPASWVRWILDEEPRDAAKR